MSDVTNERGEKWFSFWPIFSIQRTRAGFQFAEECDYWHKTTLSKDDAISLLEAAIQYIKSDDFGVIPDIADSPKERR